jgi:hypothetical protein
LHRWNNVFRRRRFIPFAEQMHLDDAPMPAVGASDVLIQVVSAGINPVDWKIRAGGMAQRVPKAFPITLGQDATPAGRDGREGKNDPRCGFSHERLTWAAWNAI